MADRGMPKYMSYKFIQMKLCPISLDKWLAYSENRNRNLDLMKLWFKQIVSAVAYIHGKGKIHGDLKVSKSRTSGVGTPKYMAPEQSLVFPRYNSKTDMFTLGLILAELCFPLNNDNDLKIFNMYRCGKSYHGFKRLPEVNHVIHWLTNKDDACRPDCEELLHHPFLQKIDIDYFKKTYSSEFMSKFEVQRISTRIFFGIQYEARNLEDSNMYSITRMTEIPEHTMEADMGEARALSTLRHEGIRACYDSWFEKPPYGWQEDADCDLKIKLGVGYINETYPVGAVYIYMQKDVCKIERIISQCNIEICISTLEDWLEANQERGFKHAKLWFKQIISAVAYIHANNVIHRDLQPNKIYLDQHNNLKLCNDDNDQEQHGIYDEIMRENRTNSERGIEMLYAAPEIKPRSRWPPSVYSAKVDVFRLGCIFIEICYAMNKDVRKEVFDAFREGTTHSILDDNPELKEFTSWICTVDSFKRPT